MSFNLESDDFYQFTNNFFQFLVEEKFVNDLSYDDFSLCLALSLPNIAEYCNKYEINITELDQIKVVVFSITHLQKKVTDFNVENYLSGVFSLLNKSYIYNKKFSIVELQGSIKICANLIKDNQIISVYTYIKGIQESMESAAPKNPFLYWHTQEKLAKITHALISVSNKTGVVEFAKQLKEIDITIFSTGGTAQYLKDNQIAVIDIEEYTNFPEMMNGRIKTINPKIHGGILARRGEDFEVMKEYNIPPIDLVVVNLYPFEQTIANPDCTLEQAIENIDIGGPTMLRAAAKNHKDVTVVVDSSDYAQVLTEIMELGHTNLITRQQLALKTFEHTARYDGAIANYLGKGEHGFSQTLNLQFKQKQVMRYGENSHQNAALYVEHNLSHACISNSEQTQGKELSYNNIVDADAALECVRQFKTPACVIVKHANPSGVAVRATIFSAYLDAYKTDPTSAFGGIIAFNKPLDYKTAQAIVDRQFVEVIIAPSINDNAQQELAKKPNVRVLICGELTNNNHEMDYKRINGGLLMQDKDTGMVETNDFKCVTKVTPTNEQLSDLAFAWRVAKFVKSNAIVYAKNQMTIGVGAGQMSRIYSAKIAGIKAQDENLEVVGCVMASDAFFPFRDGIDAAVKAGIKAIIQPGGSMRDDEVIAAANEAGIAMVFTGMRHFRH